MAVTITALSKTSLRITLQIDNPSGDNVGSVVRVDPNGTRTVRAEAGQLPSTAVGIVIRDHEYALLDRALITYTAYSATGVALGSLTIGEGHPMWNTQRGLLNITVPTKPENSVTLNENQGIHGAVISRWDDGREARSTVHHILGREDPIVVLQHAASRKGSFDLSLPSLEEAQRAERGFGQPLVFQLRQSDQHTLDMYFTTGNLTLSHSEEDWARFAGPVNQPERRWTLNVEFQEVGWPTGYVQPVNVWTWNQVMAENGDWNALMATYASWALVLDHTPGVI